MVAPKLSSVDNMTTDNMTSKSPKHWPTTSWHRCLHLCLLCISKVLYPDDHLYSDVTSSNRSKVLVHCYAKKKNIKPVTPNNHLILCQRCICLLRSSSVCFLGCCWLKHLNTSTLLVMKRKQEGYGNQITVSNHGELINSSECTACRSLRHKGYNSKRIFNLSQVEKSFD